MKILVIDDNERLAQRIKERIGKHFIVDIAPTGEQGLILAKEIDYSVIVLDLVLPDMPGLEVCRQLRAAKRNMPILILSGIGQTLSKVELLDAGADDYAVKPLDFDELRARVQALARRREERVHIDNLRYKDLELNIESKEVYRDGKLLQLRRKEFDILQYLVSNPGRILTRQMIMNHVWSDESTSWITTIDVHIKHLRDKIDKPFDTKIIKTAYGLGYKID